LVVPTPPPPTLVFIFTPLWAFDKVLPKNASPNGLFPRSGFLFPRPRRRWPPKKKMWRPPFCSNGVPPPPRNGFPPFYSPRSVFPPEKVNSPSFFLEMGVIFPCSRNPFVTRNRFVFSGKIAPLGCPPFFLRPLLLKGVLFFCVPSREQAGGCLFPPHNNVPPPLSKVLFFLFFGNRVPPKPPLFFGRPDPFFPPVFFFLTHIRRVVSPPHGWGSSFPPLCPDGERSFSLSSSPCRTLFSFTW